MKIIIDESMVNSVWTEDGKFSLYNFYTNIAKEVNMFDETKTYNCTHINVTPNIQDMWIKQYKERIDKDNLTPLIILLAMMGPKACLEEDDDYIVEIEDGFITDPS